MGNFKSTGKALGELVGNLKKTDWWLKQAASQGASIFVYNPIGNRVVAYIKGHVFHEDRHVGDAYHCADGHEYLKVHDKTYRYNPDTDSFYHATV
ncbi:hypothetical protein [Mucilaginibacter sp. HD30]